MYWKEIFKGFQNYCTKRLLCLIKKVNIKNKQKTYSNIDNNLFKFFDIVSQ